MSLLCVSITDPNIDSAMASVRAAAQSGADIVELRLDLLTSVTADHVGSLIKTARRESIQTLATCRCRSEGGQWKGSEAQRLAVIVAAARSGADYIDVEYETWRTTPDLVQQLAPLRSASTQLILSKHNFEHTPAELSDVFDQIAGMDADIVKFAAKAEWITDAVRMLDATLASAQKRPTIGICMGEAGVMTRILAKNIGGFLTFCSLDKGKESAPGQVTIEEMRTLYRWDKVMPKTKVYGVIGCPVGHSMSPAMHNAAFDQINHDGVYLPLLIEPAYDAFAAFIDACLEHSWLDLRGCSVTIPHKENLLRYVKQRGGDIEPLAERIGVANTLAIDADRGVSACNTDYRGAIESLCQGLNCDTRALGGKSVCMLGSGGAARGIVAGLKDVGAHVTIRSRRQEPAVQLQRDFGADDWVSLADVSPITQDIVINCTPLGMHPNEDTCPLVAEQMSKGCVVFDTVYNPFETKLLKMARDRGCVTIDGVHMLVNQAAAQFKLWTGQDAPTDLMRRVVVDRLTR